MKQNKRVYQVCIFLFLMGCLWTCWQGSIPWNAVWEGALHRFSGSSSEWNPLLDERIPRLIVLLCTGASLAATGAVMQALFQNPLAAPSVLGISSGGSLMVIPVFALGWHVSYPFSISIAAFCGCLITLLLVYSLARYHGPVQMHNLILTGIAISSLLLSLQGAILYSLRDQWQLIQLITEWEVGSTLDRSWRHVHVQLPLALAGLAVVFYYRKEINLLALGDEEAASLGVDAAKVRWRLFLCVAMMTAGVIAAVGMIMFYGLILPHVMRKLSGSDHIRLIPLCIGFGAVVLLFMDLGLRALDVRALALGNVSAIVGGLALVVLLMRSQKQYV